MDQQFHPTLLGFSLYTSFEPDALIRSLYLLPISDDEGECIHYHLEHHRPTMSGEVWQLLYDNDSYLVKIPLTATVREFFECVTKQLSYLIDNNHAPSVQHLAFYKRLERLYKISALIDFDNALNQG